MNYIFYFLTALSIIYAIFSGNLENMSAGLFDGVNLAVKISFSLIGIMSFWLGIMRVAEKSGMVKVIAKLIFPVMKILFKDVPSNNPANADIALSITANALGLTNAATPIGLKVMQELQEINTDKKSASNAMCMFLGMNTAGFQIIPATVIAVLAGCGAKNPADIILPTLLVTTIAFIVAIITAKIFEKFWKPQTDGGLTDAE